MAKKMGFFNPFRSPFRKKKKRYGDYVIDLGKLKEKGIIQESIEAEAVAITDSPAGTETSTDSSERSGLGFLGSLAGAGNESDSGTMASSSTSPRFSREAEEKLDMISDRIYKLIERVDLMEHKLNRVEKRLGLNETY